jgi:cysteine synthase A
MPEHSRYYILAAFLLGIVLTKACKERSAKQETLHIGSKEKLRGKQELKSKTTISNGSNNVKKSVPACTILCGRGAGSIKEGIEGCIGDTPLIKIKSLSDYTGCEILAKAEVGFYCPSYRRTR